MAGPFLTPGLVDGLTDDPGNVELVEGDRSVWQRLTGSLDEGWGHVHANLRDRGRIAVVSVEIFSEPGYRRRILAFGSEQHSRHVEVDEDADVVVTTTARGLVDSYPLYSAVITHGHCLVHV